MVVRLLRPFLSTFFLRLFSSTTIPIGVVHQSTMAGNPSHSKIKLDPDFQIQLKDIPVKDEHHNIPIKSEHGVTAANHGALNKGKHKGPAKLSDIPQFQAQQPKSTQNKGSQKRNSKKKVRDRNFMKHYPDRKDTIAHWTHRKYKHIIDGKTFMSSPADVSPQQRDGLRDIVLHIKQMHFGMGYLIDKVTVTDADVQSFLRHVFEDGSWNTLAEFEQPKTQHVKAQGNPDDVMIGTLRHGDTSSNRPKPHLAAGKPVYFRALPNPRGMVEFQPSDGDRRMLPRMVMEDLERKDDWTWSRIYQNCMELHDQRLYQTSGRRNLAWAVFLARRRLVHWAHPGSIKIRKKYMKPGQQLDEGIPFTFLKLRFCFQCVCTNVNDQGAHEALEELKKHHVVPFLS